MALLTSGTPYSASGISPPFLSIDCEPARRPDGQRVVPGAKWRRPLGCERSPVPLPSCQLNPVSGQHTSS